MAKYGVFFWILFCLTACQPGFSRSDGLPLNAPGTATITPLPLTGAQQSLAGASALTIQPIPGGIDYALTPIDVTTGKPKPGFSPVNLGSRIGYAFSPDRSQFAYISYGAADCPAQCLHLFDLRAWKPLLQPLALTESFTTWASDPVFDARGERLAVTFNDNTANHSQLVLVDLKQGVILQQSPLDLTVHQMHFLPDGSLAVFGARPSADETGSGGAAPADAQSAPQIVGQALLLDPDGLQPIWQSLLAEVHFGVGITAGHELDNGSFSYTPAADFTKDGRKLILLAADQPSLISIDYAQNSVISTPVRPRVSLLEQILAFGASRVSAKALNGVYLSGTLSADDRRFFVLGETYTTTQDEQGERTTRREALGLRVIEVSTGLLEKQIDTEASLMQMHADGKTLSLIQWNDTGQVMAQPVTTFLNLQNLEMSGQRSGEVRGARLLNGRFAWFSTLPQPDASTRFEIFDPEGRQPRSQWTAPAQQYADWVIIP